ncbi:YIPF3, partial [Acrasis kona]
MKASNNDEWFDSGVEPSFETNDQFVNIDAIDTENTKTFNTTPKVKQEEPLFPGSAQSQLAVGFAKSMLQSAGIQARVPAFFSFSFLRPYFENVNERQLGNKIISTLYRPLAPMEGIIEQPDLYGPLVAVFGLAITLVISMKATSVDVYGGSLIGSSLFTVFLYWALASVAVFGACNIFKTELSAITIASIVGYTLFPISLIMTLTCLNIPFLFMLCFFTVGLLSAANFAKTLSSRTSNKMKGIILMSIAAAIHLLFILYCRYAFIVFRAAVENIQANDV